MRVLVDSSVWIDVFNDADTPQRRRLQQLVAERADVVTCGLVVTEVLQGARRGEQRFLITGHFRRLRFLEATGIELYLRAAGVYRSLRERGLTVRSAIDCLVAAVAERHECQLLARDRDLEAIVASGIVKTSLLG